MRTRKFDVVRDWPKGSQELIGYMTINHTGHTINWCEFAYHPPALVRGQYPLLAFPDRTRTYRKEGALFPFLFNRILQPDRPDFDQHVASLGLTREEANPVAILAATQGRRVTDDLRLIPDIPGLPDRALGRRE